MKVLAVDYEAGLGVMTEELEVLGFGDIGGQTSALGCEVLLMASVKRERKDMPCVKGMAIACLERERGNLVLWRNGCQSGDRQGAVVCIRGEKKLVGTDWQIPSAPVC